jgi:hypothetical protein
MKGRKTMEHIFNDRPSAKYRQAVAILRELCESEGADIVNRAFAEVIAEHRKNVFLESFGVTIKKDHHICFNRLEGMERCSCDSTGGFDSPICDHALEMEKDGKTHSIVAQPYVIFYDDLKKVIEYCDNNDLKMSISAATSWHFPGNTLIVVFTRYGESEKQLIHYPC